MPSPTFKRSKIKRRIKSPNNPHLTIEGREIKRRKTGIKRRRAFYSSRKRKIIIKCLEQRLPIGRAVILAGVSYEAYRKWIERGEMQPKKYPLYAKFARRVRKAQAHAELEALDIIRKAANGGNKIVETTVTVGSRGNETKRVWREQMPVWQAAAWYLERRHREDYGRDPKNEDDNKSVEEKALEIKAAADALFNSVPTKEEG